MILPIGLFGFPRRSFFNEPPKERPTPMSNVDQNKIDPNRGRTYSKNPEPQNIALPTVGRIVYYFDPDYVNITDKGPMPKPLPGIVVEVEPESYTIVTLHVFVPDGIRVMQQVRHVGFSPPEGGFKSVGHWDWMDFQKGQAAKTEELERQLKGAQGGPATGVGGTPRYPAGDPRNDTL